MDKPYKALGALVIALVGGIAIGYVDDALTTGEMWAAIASGVAAGGAVYGISNKPRDEAGEIGVVEALLIVLVVVVILVAVGVIR